MLLGSIILAGGLSTRMGRQKAALPLAGSTLLGRTVDMLMSCSHPVLVVARSDHDELPPLPIESELTFDSDPGQGPLSALCDGMRWQRARNECDAVFVTGCDMPFLNPAAIGWLADLLGDHDLVVPQIGADVQPLAAIYSLKVLPVAEQLLRSGDHGPRRLVGLVKARIVTEAEIDRFDPQRRFLRSVDTPQDYEAAKRELGA